MSELTAHASYYLGLAYLRKGFYDEGLEFSEKACKIYESLISEKVSRRGVLQYAPTREKELKQWIGKSLNNIGLIHCYRADHERALNFYKKASR